MKKIFYFIIGASLIAGVTITLFVSEYFYGDVSYLLGYGAPQQAPTSTPAAVPASQPAPAPYALSIQEFVDQSHPLKEASPQFGQRFTISGPIYDVNNTHIFLDHPDNGQDNSRTLISSHQFRLKFFFEGNPKLSSRYKEGDWITLEAILKDLQQDRQYFSFIFSDPQIVSAP